MWATAALPGAQAMPASGDQTGPSEETPTFPADAPLAGTDDQLRTVIREGYDRSPTFRFLVDHLVDHKTTVHVHRVPGLAVGLGACLLHQVAVADDGERLLWVLVRHNEPSDRLIASLAHELQHVHEALDADVQTGPEMERVFQRIGERVGSSGRTRNYAVYETQAALDVQDRVKRELRTRLPGRGNAR
jgi:hypothetical protein